MRLCFGTFARVLLPCTDFTAQELGGVLAKLVDPKSRYIEDKTAVHKLFKCDINFVKGSDDAASVSKEDIILGFEESVIPRINVDKIECVVLALCDIIFKDNEIEQSYESSFEKYTGVKKDALLSQSAYILPEFLAGLLLYTVEVVNNKVGVECVKSVTEEYVDGITKKYKKDVRKNSGAKVVVFPTRQPKEILELAVQKCYIREFISSDPTNKVKIDFVNGAEHFVNTMSYVISLLDGESEVWSQIGILTQMMDEYNGYLSQNLIPHKDKKSIYLIPMYHEEKMKWVQSFESTTDEYRTKINDFHGKIAEIL